MQYATYASPLGAIYLTADAKGLTRLTFRETEDFSEPATDLSAFAPVLQWLDGYFAGSPVPPAFPMNPKGTPFQMLIWQLLLQIPYGQICTYGDLAREAARRMGKQCACKLFPKMELSVPWIGFEESSMSASLSGISPSVANSLKHSFR